MTRKENTDDTQKAKAPRKPFRLGARQSGPKKSGGTKPRSRPYSPERASSPKSASSGEKRFRPKTSASRSGGKKTPRRRTSGDAKKRPAIARFKKEVSVPPIGDAIRVIPIGGVEEVGRNMTIVEYGEDILVFDAGIQFVSEDDTPGIDFMLPNTKYLEERKHKIKGLIITHGHLDHIGGVPYIMEKIGNPPIYSRYLTTIMIKKRLEEFPEIPEPDIRVVDPEDRIKIGNLNVKFFPVTHSIPDSMGTSIETPHGNVIITGDLKLEHEDGIPSEKEERIWGEVGKQKNLLFIADSTNVERPGFSTPERVIYENLENIIRNTSGRLIIGTFASQFERMIRIIMMAENLGKKIVVEGRSMKNNIEIAKLAGILKIKDHTIIPAEAITDYPSDRIIVLATGAQGEEFAALMRMATKKHKYIQFNERDTVVLSSSVIPGNELSVQKLKDNLYRHDLKVIHYRMSEVHSTGHGNAGELAWINKKVGAKYFMPAYGHHSMLKIHAEVARSIGMKKEDIIVPDNGSVIEIRDKGEKITVLKEKAPSSVMMVDGFSIGDVQEVVIRDRQALAQDGIFVVMAVVDLSTGKLRKSPDIISRGFVYLRESQEMLQSARRIVKRTVEEAAEGVKPINFDFIKKDVTDNVSRFLFKHTNKRPMVIPVILGV